MPTTLVRDGPGTTDQGRTRDHGPGTDQGPRTKDGPGTTDQGRTRDQEPRTKDPLIWLHAPLAGRPGLWSRRVRRVGLLWPDTTPSSVDRRRRPAARLRDARRDAAPHRARAP